LRSARAAGATLKQVERATSIALASVARIERGEQLASEAQATALAAYFDKSVDDLFTEPLLRESEVARLKKVGKPQTVKRAIELGELRRANEVDSYYVLVTLSDAEAWEPRQQGGQRRNQERVCARDGCTERFLPVDADHIYCSKSCAALDREDAKRAGLIATAAALDAVPLQAVVARNLGIGSRAAHELVSRGTLAAFPLDSAHFYGRRPLLISSAEAARLVARRRINRARRLSALPQPHWSAEAVMRMHESVRGLRQEAARLYAAAPPASGRKRRGGRPSKPHLRRRRSPEPANFSPSIPTGVTARLPTT
jgi:transcriptional regulator with XRE-family HTH domain